MTNNRSYSVKDVMHLCHLTRKQLYVYEEKGLVTPTRNEDNQYRSYTEDQVISIEFIRECRELGFSFDSIADMMQEMTPVTLHRAIRQAMEDARVRLDASIQQYERSMARYTAMLDATSILTEPEVAIKQEHISAQNTVFYDFEGSFDDDVMSYYKQFVHLDKLVIEGGFTRISGKREQFSQVFCDDYSINQGQQRIRLSYQIKEEQQEDPHFSRIEAFDAVTTTHVGYFTQPLYQTYQKMVAYAEEHQLLLAHESYEEHVIEPSFSYNNSDMWVTKIIIPIIR